MKVYCVKIKDWSIGKQWVDLLENPEKIKYELVKIEDNSLLSAFIFKSGVYYGDEIIYIDINRSFNSWAHTGYENYLKNYIISDIRDKKINNLLK